jgi:membrane-associated phospholipid phosphatase
LTLPEIWDGATLGDLAKFVNNDWPGLLAGNLLTNLVVTQRVKADPAIIPFRSLNDPIGVQHRTVAINGWTYAQITPINYYLKWYYGRPRPEEIAWLITQKKLNATSRVPQDVVDTILAWNLTSAANFTTYANGSPNHPSWPSGHATLAQTSLWAAVVFNLSDAQVRQTVLFDYAYGFARIAAGIHTPTELVQGLKLGRAIIARKLPDYLNAYYGSDKAAVAAKIKKYNYDWAKYDPIAGTFTLLVFNIHFNQQQRTFVFLRNTNAKLV